MLEREMEKEYPPPRKRKKKGVLMPFATRLLCDGNEVFEIGVKEGFGGGMRNERSGEEVFGVRASMGKGGGLGDNG